MDSHSTIGGIWDVLEVEVVVKLFSDDIKVLVPGACVAHGGQSQRDQGSDSKTHVV